MKRILVIPVLYFSMLAAGCSSSDSSDLDGLGDGGEIEAHTGLDSGTDGKAGTGGRSGRGDAGGDAAAEGGNQGEIDASGDGAKPELPDASEPPDTSEPTDASDETNPNDSSVEEDVVLDINFKYDSQTKDSGLQEACVDQSAKAEPVPLDIYFILDKSGSMRYSNRWSNAVKSIGGYVSSPKAKGNKAALQYFPIDSGVCSTGSGYSTPAVGLQLLNGTATGHAASIVNSLNATSPNGGTPTEGALRGLAAFTKANKTSGRIIIGILVTDGTPESAANCDESDATLKSIAADHYKSNGIHTFMVGMSGADFVRLEMWANYSGALSHTGDCGDGNATCRHYSVGNGDPAVFINALNKIQNSVLACTFKVVQPTSGVLNPDLVSVEYYPGGTGPMQKISKVANAAACGNNQGFYFDNPTKPKIITLCPASCKKVQGDPKAQVKIRIACEGS